MAVAVLLAKAAPADLDAPARKKLRTLQSAGERVEAAHAKREGGRGAAIQPLRQALASGFAAADLALAGTALLPARFTDKGARAQQARAIVFPAGRAFTNAPAIEATMVARRILARIADKKLAAELKELIGPEHLRTMQAVTDDLAEALGLGDGVRETHSATAVADAMAKYTTALSAYTRALAAHVDEDDEASCESFLAAVAPIDRFRSTHGSAGSQAEGSDPPVATATVTPAANDAPAAA
jgi:hypothetical protein